MSNKVFILSNPQKPSEFILQQFEGLTIAKQTNVHLICSEVTPLAELAPTEKDHVQGIFLKTLIRLQRAIAPLSQMYLHRRINMHAKAP